MNTLEQLTRLGWRVVEIALMLVVLCVLLHIILGADSGSFITLVAGNATSFLQALPPGAFLGVVLILVLYWAYRSRVSK